MGNPKQKWTSEEEEALVAGIAKHGTGKWKQIQRDPEFNPQLYSRSNIDLKDKWRNMNVNATGQGSREKSRPPKPKSATDGDLPVSSDPQTSDHVASVARDAMEDLVVDDSPKTGNGKDTAKYNAMIIEAISTLNEPDGAATTAIHEYIEHRQEVPPNFRRQLSNRLRRMVGQEKLEKIQNGYRIKSAGAPPTKGPSSTTQKEVGSRLSQSNSFNTLSETLEEAASGAAYRIAEAENKSFVASEAMKEAERVSRLAEENEAVLKLAIEIVERCSRGEIVLMA